MRYFLVAGEPSGDQHAAGLMTQLKLLDPEAEFRFIGGDRMREAGGEPLIHIRDLAFMGFTQILTRLPVIRRSFRLCHDEIIRFKPDIIIPVDFGGFNLRLIRWTHRKGFRVIYYITPKVWAWLPGRAKKLARFTVKALCILPFEPPFLAMYGVDAEYVGNPVRDSVLAVTDQDPVCLSRQLDLADKPVIALLPGSREQEIRKILPVMLSVVPEFPGYRFVVSGCDPFDPGFYQEIIDVPDVGLVHNQTLELLRVAHAALVTSGTATLETALLGTPQVVCYRTTSLSFLIARMLIRIRYVSLVNLILDRPCVEELIQGKLNRVRLTTATRKVVCDEEFRNRMIKDYDKLRLRLGQVPAAEAAARIVFSMAGKP